jgi:hypothetical protein
VINCKHTDTFQYSFKEEYESSQEEESKVGGVGAAMSSSSDVKVQVIRSKKKLQEFSE